MQQLVIKMIGWRTHPWLVKPTQIWDRWKRWNPTGGGGGGGCLPRLSILTFALASIQPASPPPAFRGEAGDIDTAAASSPSPLFSCTSTATAALGEHRGARRQSTRGPFRSRKREPSMREGDDPHPLPSPCLAQPPCPHCRERESTQSLLHNLRSVFSTFLPLRSG